MILQVTLRSYPLNPLLSDVSRRYNITDALAWINPKIYTCKIYLYNE